MTTLTATRVAQFPRVNLLPPEIAEAARLRRLQVLIGVALLAVLGLVALLFLWASGQVSKADQALQDEQTHAASLQAQVADYAEVPKVAAEVDATQTALVTAMTPEIRWSFLMNDMALTIPNSSRLTSWVATNTAAADQLGGTTVVTPTTPVPGVAESMGTVTFLGKANSFDAVAQWLQSLSRQKAYEDPSLQSAVKDVEADTVGTVYTVSSSASLSIDAASNRYQQVLEGE